MLRDALVAAALPHAPLPPRSPRPPLRRGPPRRPAMRCGSTACSGPATRPRPTRRGSPAEPVELVESGELAALVSRVPLAEFGEEPLRRNLNELAVAGARRARTRGRARARARRGDDRAAAPLHDLRGRRPGARDARRRPRGASSRCSTCSKAGRSGGSSCCSTRRGWPPRRAAVLPDAEGRGGAGRRARRRRRLHAAAPARAPGGGRRRRARRRRSRTRSTPGCRTGPSTRSRDRPQNRELSGHEGDMALNAAYLVEAGPRRRAARARRRSRGAPPRRSARGSS